MRRSLIQLSDRTLVVSLPHAWIKRVNLKKGDEVFLEESEHKLVVHPSKSIAEKNYSIDVSSFSPEMCVSLISVLHKSGYDNIELLNGNQEGIKKILERISLLINYEVLDHTSKRLWIKCITSDSFDDFDSLLRRTFNLTSHFAKLVFDALAKNPKELKNLLELEEINNKLTNYCHRLINKKQLTPKDHYVYTIIWLLEKIGDSLKYVCSMKNPNLSPILKKEFFGFLSLFDKLVSVYYSNDLKKLNDLRFEIKSALNSFPLNSSSELSTHIHSLQNYLNLMLGSMCGVMI